MVHVHIVYIMHFQTLSHFILYLCKQSRDSNTPNEGKLPDTFARYTYCIFFFFWGGGVKIEKNNPMAKYSIRIHLLTTRHKFCAGMEML